MKKNGKVSSNMKRFLLLLLGVFMAITISTEASAQWHYGIGTGLMRMNIEGDAGINTAIAGPVTIALDLDPDDISDLTKSAFGFGGYVTDGTWMIQYSLLNLELEGEKSNTVPLVGVVAAKVGFEVTGGEVTVGYPVYSNSSVKFGVLGGARYTKHELSADVAIGVLRQSRNIENDWTDVLGGVTVAFPFKDKWVWNNRLDAGFGGSEGTYSANTGLTWRFLKHWSGTVYGDYTDVEFENGSKGDSDWYLYDAEEFGTGLTILYHW